METKFCPDCRRTLDVTRFTNNRRSRDGLAFYCKDCARARHTASRRQRLGPPKHRGSLRPADVPDGMKWCPECDSVLDVVAFPRNRSQRNGLGTYCKQCHNRITRQNRESHGGARNYHLRRRYGITAKHFDMMFAEQGGLCAICREGPAAHTDHDHATGRVRGLLCFNCNQGLGNFRDRPEVMLAAIDYLETCAVSAVAARVGASVCGDLGPVPTGGRPSQAPDDEWAAMFAEVQAGFDATALDAELRGS